jgi:hypothetical protein
MPTYRLASNGAVWLPNYGRAGDVSLLIYATLRGPLSVTRHNSDAQVKERGESIL